MTQDDVIRMAREAEMVTSTGASTLVSGADLIPQLQRFAPLVAAAEREECARLVVETKEWRGKNWYSTLCSKTKAAIAAAIRARSGA